MTDQNNNGKRKKQIPSLRFGMTNLGTGKDNGQY